MDTRTPGSCMLGATCYHMHAVYQHSVLVSYIYGHIYNTSHCAGVLSIHRWMSNYVVSYDMTNIYAICMEAILRIPIPKLLNLSELILM